MLSILAFLLLFPFAHVNGAPPPIRPVAEVGDAARSLVSESVSTDLTLGGPFARLDHREHSLWQSHPVTPSSESSSGIYNAFTHSASSPFSGPRSVSGQSWRDAIPAQPIAFAPPAHFPPASPGFEGASSSTLPSASADRWLQHKAESVVPQSEAQLDTFLGGALYNGMGTYELPHHMDYVPSTWFDATYTHYVEDRRFGRSEARGRTWESPMKRQLTPELLQFFLRKGQKLFFPNVRVYKIRFPGTEGNGGQAGDVLARYMFTEYGEYGVTIPAGTLIVWKTSGQGARLALVGLYHCPRTLLRELTALQGSRKFDVTFGARGETFLIPHRE